MSEILIADDAAKIREGLSVLLRKNGYEVRTAANGEEALREYAIKRPDLILLDVIMPKRNGYEVITEIRRNDSALPVIFLSAKGENDDVVLGLGMGSTDYIAKPFDNQVLLARIAAALRSANAVAARQDNGVFKFASFRVDSSRFVIVGPDGEEQPIKPRMVRMLKIFADHPDKLISREDFLGTVWGMKFWGTTRTVDQYISALRKILGKDGERIETYHGIGYRYVTEDFGD